MTAGYLSARSAAAYLDKTYKAFDQFVRRHGVPCKRLGRVRLFLKADLDRVVDVMTDRARRERAAV